MSHRTTAVTRGFPPWLGWVAAGLVVCLAGAVFPLPVLAAAAAGAALLLLLRAWPGSGMALLLIAVLVPHFKLDIGPISVRVEHVAVLVAGALLLWQVFTRRRRLWLDVPFLCALVWWIINLFATLLHAPDPGDSVRHVLRLSMMVLTYLVVINLLRTPDQWWTAFRWLLGLAVAEVLFGLAARVIYEFGINLGVQTTTVLPVPVPYGTLEEGNMFGSHSAVWALAFLGVFLALPRSRKGLRSAMLAAIGIMALGVLFSLARGAWIALLIGLAVFFVFHKSNPSTQMKRAGLLLIGGPLLFIAMMVIVENLPATVPLAARLKSFTTAFTDQTFGNRMADFIQAIDDWREYPLIGWGPGTFFQIYGQRWGTDAWIANQTVRILQETGVAGLLALWGFLGSVLWIGARALRRLPDAGVSRGALLGLGTGFLALLVAFQATDGTWLAYMWLHAALLVAGARLIVQESTEDARAIARLADSG